ncbi:MAG: metal-dependent phosphohydrolase, partial [Dehalococcoidia bacterium]
RDVGDVAIDTIFLNLADHLAARGPMIEQDKWREHADTLRYVIEERFKEDIVVYPPKLIDGNDIIDKYGLAPGPEIGRLLEAVREAQASGR